MNPWLQGVVVALCVTAWGFALYPAIAMLRAMRPQETRQMNKGRDGYLSMVEAWQREVVQEARRLGILVVADGEGVYWLGIYTSAGCSMEHERVARAARFIHGAKDVRFGAHGDGESVVSVKDLVLAEIQRWHETVPKEGGAA